MSSRLILAILSLLAPGIMNTNAGIDLSELAGNFSCRVRARGSDDPAFVSGSAQVRVRVARNGRSARIVINGSIPTSAGGTIPFSQTLRLRGNRTVANTSVYPIPLGDPGAGAGRFGQRSAHRVRGNTVGVVSGTRVRQRFNIAVRPRGTRKRIQANLVSRAGGFPVLRLNMSGTSGN